MKVNGAEMSKMIEETYKPGFEMVEVSNMLYSLAKEYGFAEDPRYKELNTKLTRAMIDFQTMSFDRGMDVCRKNAIITAINSTGTGKRLVNKVKKELGSY